MRMVPRTIMALLAQGTQRLPAPVHLTDRSEVMLATTYGPAHRAQREQHDTDDEQDDPDIDEKLQATYKYADEQQNDAEGDHGAP